MQNNNCCRKGILYGLLPHSFCIVFLILSALGTSLATTLMRPLLVTPYLVPTLVLLSFLMATISSIIYLKKNHSLSFGGILQNKHYLLVLYATIIGVNLFIMLVIFPLAANLKFSTRSQILGLSSESVRVNIPCTGHAPLIISELRRVDGIIDVNFKFPNIFEIKYDPKKVTNDQILNLEIFKNFKAEEI